MLPNKLNRPHSATVTSSLRRGHFATIRMIDGGVEESASPVTSSVGTLILVRACGVIEILWLGGGPGAWWHGRPVCPKL